MQSAAVSSPTATSAPASAWAAALARTPQKGLIVTAAAAAGAREKLAKRGTPNAMVRVGVK